jgi:hypothetical protein
LTGLAKVVDNNVYAPDKNPLRETNASSRLNLESEITSAVASLEKSVTHSTNVELEEVILRSLIVWTTLVTTAAGSLEITSKVIDVWMLLR